MQASKDAFSEEALEFRMLILHYTSLMTACALIDIRRDDNDLDAPLTFNHEDPYLFRAKLDARHIDSDYHEQLPVPMRGSCVDDPNSGIGLGLSAEQRAELERLGGGDSPANIRSCVAALARCISRSVRAAALLLMLLLPMRICARATLILLRRTHAVVAALVAPCCSACRSVGDASDSARRLESGASVQPKRKAGKVSARMNTVPLQMLLQSRRNLQRRYQSHDVNSFEPVDAKDKGMAPTSFSTSSLDMQARTHAPCLSHPSPRAATHATRIALCHAPSLLVRDTLICCLLALLFSPLRSATTTPAKPPTSLTTDATQSTA